MSEYHRSSEWIRFIQKNRPIVEASLPQPCAQGKDCVLGGTVHPGQKFDMAHLPGYEHVRPPRLEFVRPAHSKCNRRAGQQISVRNRERNKARDNRWLTW